MPLELCDTAGRRENQFIFEGYRWNVEYIWIQMEDIVRLSHLRALQIVLLLICFAVCPSFRVVKLDEIGAGKVTRFDIRARVTQRRYQTSLLCLKDLISSLTHLWCEKYIWGSFRYIQIKLIYNWSKINFKMSQICFNIFSAIIKNFVSFQAYSIFLHALVLYEHTFRNHISPRPLSIAAKNIFLGAHYQSFWTTSFISRPIRSALDQCYVLH